MIITIKKGEKCLIVGPSGGGKSTLLKLLRKYFAPTKGEVLIDGQRLVDVTKSSYFKNISNVEQTVFLFEDTIRNNITLYKEYSEEEIEEAIEKTILNLESITVINVSHVLFEETKNKYDKVLVVKNKEVLNTVFA